MTDTMKKLKNLLMNTRCFCGKGQGMFVCLRCQMKDILSELESEMAALNEHDAEVTLKEAEDWFHNRANPQWYMNRIEQLRALKGKGSR